MLDQEDERLAPQRSKAFAEIGEDQLSIDSNEKSTYGQENAKKLAV